MSRLIVVIVLILAVAPLCRADTIDVTIFHTTDLHGNFEPITDYEGRTNVGGIYQLAQVLADRRTNVAHALYLDNGDSLQGSMLNYLARGGVMIDCLNALGCSVWNLGNHEFDWGIALLGENIRRFSNSVLSANTHWCGAAPSPLASVQPWVLREVGGMRLAIIGMTHPKVPYWSRQVLLQDTAIELPVTALLRIMPAVRAAKPDAIILMSHIGYYDDRGMAEEPLQAVLTMFPDIDVVIGGHTHVAVPAVMLGRTLYTQAGYYGIALGEVHLTFERTTRTLLDRRALLIPIGPGGAQSAELRRLVGGAAVRAHAAATQDVCRLEGTLGGARAADAESPEQTLMCEAIAAAAQADIVLHGAFQSHTVISNRMLTMADIFALVPYENRIVVGNLNVAEVTRALEGLMTWWDTPYFAFPYGLQVKADSDGMPGERIVAVRDARGKPLDESRRYRVAFNSYMAASGGQRYPELRAVLESPAVAAEDLAVTTRDAVTAFLHNQGVYTPRVVRTITTLHQPPPRLATVTPATPLRPGALQLIEFAYVHPGSRDEEQAGEWFAVRNTGVAPLNLQGYIFSDCDEGGDFRIDKDLPLASGEVLVFCHTLTQFRKHPYGRNPYLRVFEYGSVAGRLNLGNRGDELVIIDPQGALADQVVYGQRRALWPHWPASSKAPNHKIGQSLIKRIGGWEPNGAPLSEW